MTLDGHASAVLDRLIGLGSADSVLVISDPSADDAVVAALVAAVTEAQAGPITISMPDVLKLGDELPRTVETAMAMADVVLLVVQWLPAWVAAKGFWRAVHEYGTRVFQFDPPYRLALENGITDAELATVAEHARTLRDRVRGADGLLIVDRFGNELRCRVDSTNLSVSSEFPGGFGFHKFPTGLFTLGVLPGSYAGRIVWDAVEGHPMREGDLIEVEVADGAVCRVAGQGTGMEHVAEQVAVCPAYALLTEFGLGTNPALPQERFLREAWHEGANRSAGIVHFGLGSAKTRGGPENTLFHTHLVARGTTVYALPDQVQVITDGQI